ncbi:MAG: hypothetical protein ETSY1_44070 [Candidatus Entotheonella factor]|uniref:HNH nuclease domain-containing protein n=1 Tax=Entotheonella factor TaxID=1429438 RepID=W4L378_ENTF1|nr:MAG: hypothetical protein ETSY1_44070 [Candidatus Entotheonella factor]
MPVSQLTRRLVRERANRYCEYCHADERWQFIRFTIDHIRPQSAGGSDKADNLALACRNCNERRGNRMTGRDPDSGEMVVLFNPRSQLWSDHFVWDTTRLRIVGQTPSGRATVVLLDLNDDRHDGDVIRIRQRDLLDGYHPPQDDPVLPDESPG